MKKFHRIILKSKIKLKIEYIYKNYTFNAKGIFNTVNDHRSAHNLFDFVSTSKDTQKRTFDLQLQSFIKCKIHWDPVYKNLNNLNFQSTFAQF
ncbi:MAG: hypothetical protein IPO85_15370 [Saprospiraceae bacterium]|uniref:Uncharacterized protein n=1 Tax=Candidatus Defluviibacterium haderslevense TaxID=2981993 RepID=A0A9D7SA76_9BACT|nr:hypothetical protein [Candidatus Defluviibacterium haderslevense]